MILVDTAVWIDHMVVADAMLHNLLEKGEVLCHPFVIGELALGNLKLRKTTLIDLHDLPSVITATDQEVLHLIEEHHLFGMGIGYIDAHLLAAVQLTPDATLWTHDRRLHAAAERLGLAIKPSARGTIH